MRDWKLHITDFKKTEEGKIMDQKPNRRILEAINNKGWNVYYRGKADEEIGMEETYRRGPIKILEKGVLYVILPRVEKSNDRSTIQAFLKKHQIEPKIIVPRTGFPYFGRMIAEFSGGDKVEDFLRPREKIFFIGIEFQNEEVRLISSAKTFMPYDVFLEALDSLRDITELTTVEPIN